MIKEAIDRVVQLAQPVSFEIHGEHYTSDVLHRVPPHVDRPRQIEVCSLESLAELVIAECAGRDERVFVRVVSPMEVRVFTELLDDESRNDLYVAKADTPISHFGWKDYVSAMIAFRSQFDQTEDVAYVLDLLSRITNESSVQTEDNGLSQAVEVRSGISFLAKEGVRPRVKLRPYRTFLEVAQPESEFLLRLDKEGRVGIFEADGGMWMLDAKRSIKEFLIGRLAEEAPNAIVMI